MKRVLAIAPYSYLPYFSGGQKLIARFLHHLAKETTLTVVSVPGNDPALAGGYDLLPWMKRGTSRYLDPTLPGKLIRLVKERNIDTLILEHPYLHWVARRVQQATGIRYILHTHNIEYQRFRSLGRWWWPVLSWYEKKAFRKADQLLFITPEDRAFAESEWNIEAFRCLDFPAGVEPTGMPADKPAARAFLEAKHGIAPEEKILLFNGLLSYGANLEALEFILDSINPLLLKKPGFRYQILVCGKGLPEKMDGLQSYRGQNILYAGFVPDIEPYFKGADLFLNPVQRGGGIKTKMVEAMAYGTSVIATRSGAAGLDPELCDGKLVIVEDNDWSTFAERIPVLAGQKSPTPAKFYRTFSWPGLIDRLIVNSPAGK